MVMTLTFMYKVLKLFPQVDCISTLQGKAYPTAFHTRSFAAKVVVVQTGIQYHNQLLGGFNTLLQLFTIFGWFIHN